MGDFLAGRLSDHYTVGTVLGNGGYSVVRHGIDKTSGAEVALKTLKAGASTAKLERELAHEIHILQRVTAIKNPNLMKYYTVR